MQSFKLHLVSLLLTFNKYLSTSNANKQRAIETSSEKNNYARDTVVYCSIREF